jgi:small subunit ribosomal protein S4
VYLCTTIYSFFPQEYQEYRFFEVNILKESINMSRYRGPRLKKIRQLGPLVGFVNKRERTKKKNRHTKKKIKKSQYRIRLEEKQKLRFYYGVNEKQLLKYVRNARREKGSTGDNLLKLLEMRLDNIIYKLNLAPTIPAARQLVSHSHVRVNQNIVNIPSYQCQVQDLIRICRDKDQKKNKRVYYSSSLKFASTSYREEIPEYKIRIPISRTLVGLKVNELLIVEHYSRQA